MPRPLRQHNTSQHKTTQLNAKHRSLIHGLMAKLTHPPTYLPYLPTYLPTQKPIQHSRFSTDCTSPTNWSQRAKYVQTFVVVFKKKKVRLEPSVGPSGDPFQLILLDVALHLSFVFNSKSFSTIDPFNSSNWLVLFLPSLYLSDSRSEMDHLIQPNFSTKCVFEIESLIFVMFILLSNFDALAECFVSFVASLCKRQFIHPSKKFRFPSLSFL